MVILVYLVGIVHNMKRFRNYTDLSLDIQIILNNSNINNYNLTEAGLWYGVYSFTESPHFDENLEFLGIYLPAPEKDYNYTFSIKTSLKTFVITTVKKRGGILQDFEVFIR